MSAGKFSRARYQGDGGTRIYKIRVQPETLALVVGAATNASEVAAVTEVISAKSSGGRRTAGLSARKIRIQFDAGNAPTGYAEGDSISLPIMSQTVFNGIIPGATGTYLAKPITVIGKTPEYQN